MSWKAVYFTRDSGCGVNVLQDPTKLYPKEVRLEDMPHKGTTFSVCSVPK